MTRAAALLVPWLLAVAAIAAQSPATLERFAGIGAFAAWQDPALLEELSSRAERLTLGERETRRMTVLLDAR